MSTTRSGSNPSSGTFQQEEREVARGGEEIPTAGQWEFPDQASGWLVPNSVGSETEAFPLLLSFRRPWPGLRWFSDPEGWL